MLLTILAMPRAQDIDTPGEVDDSYLWDQEEVPATSWSKVEDHSD